MNTTASLDARDRARRLDALDGTTVDLIVIGGGITGAGIARDAAMRGLSVALFEARDFASGTSSRSSKLIHGGLRYMAQGDLALVKEAASERKAVERIAPHLAKLTPFIIPAKSVGATAKLRAGLWAFEKLGGVPKERHHEVWSKSELAEKEPALDVGGLHGAVVYPEFLTEDARLTLANMRSAAANGAMVFNYAPVLRLKVENGRATGVEVGDGLAADDVVRARVSAKVIVNAAGPWVDAVRAIEDSAAAPKLQLTKGVHLVVDRARLPISRTVILTAPDKRSVFAVPKGAFTYIGTTDTFYPNPTVWPEIEAADIDYLFETAAMRFSTPRLTGADLVSAWSGVRPLVAQPGKAASDISRKDEVWTGPAGVLSIAGGKLTAYRQMAERVVDLAEETLGRKASACRTAEETLVGGDLDVAAVEAKLSAKAGALEAERLVHLYGADAETVAADGGGPAAEARQAVLHEGALMLEDWWVRRSARAWFDHHGGMEALEPAAAEMATLLGWSEAQRASQVAACRSRHAQTLSAIQPQAAAA